MLDWVYKMKEGQEESSTSRFSIWAAEKKVVTLKWERSGKEQIWKDENSVLGNFHFRYQ